jgi:hypothetical protein
MDCTGAMIRNESGPALHADGLRVDQDVYLFAIEAVGASEGGAVRLFGAHVGGFLDWSGATMHNDSGPALAAESLRVDRNVYLRELEAVGGGDGVTLDLSRARIGGMLVFAPAQLEPSAGPGLALPWTG